MAKSDDAELKHLASEASQVIGPLQKQITDMFKLTQLMNKNPSAQTADDLATKIDDFMGDVADLKNVLKELKAAAK